MSTTPTTQTTDDLGSASEGSVEVHQLPPGYAPIEILPVGYLGNRSEPLNEKGIAHDEDLTINQLEAHVAGCKTCSNTLYTFKEGDRGRLCNIGKGKALDVKGYMFMGDDGLLYSRQDNYVGVKTVVPVDRSCTAVWSLFHALKKGLHVNRYSAQALEGTGRLSVISKTTIEDE
ncbi:hypothetical protein BDV28DRAFT_151508 [Aspergillus coremiiformis]|uniref:Uncharacterized protein n=1 Tax=Aspergillus coremiiformis TaxID=138285 RepID=A0A5N6YYU3_9EURO|nr:hypothetical protein BDV28DRAFT_151508 [Aspergillus coremiiformis]